MTKELLERANDLRCDLKRARQLRAEMGGIFNDPAMRVFHYASDDLKAKFIADAKAEIDAKIALMEAEFAAL